MRLFDEYPTLSDDMIILRKLTQDDSRALHDFARSPEIYRYLPTFLYEQKYESAEKVIALMDEECFRTRDGIILGVFPKADPHRLMGLAEIYSYNPERRKVSIGGRLAKQYWGRGIASRVTTLLKDYLLRQTDIEVITAHVAKDNKASAEMMRKNGFIAKYQDILEDWGHAEPVLIDKFVFKRSWLDDPVRENDGP